MQSTEKPLLRCDNCGETAAVIRRMPRVYPDGPELLVIEGVPVISCHSCGAAYLSSETARELERLKHDRGVSTIKRETRVVEFA